MTWTLFVFTWWLAGVLLARALVAKYQAPDN
jgi:hypothetical protein